MNKLELNSKKLLFASPLHLFKVTDCEQLNQEIIKDAYNLREASQGTVKSNKNGWHSNTDFFSRPEKSFKEIGERIIEGVNTVTKTVAPTFKIEDYEIYSNAWININPKGGFNVPHDHPNFWWSGTYYVRIPENPPDKSGCLEFLDPRTNINAMSLPKTANFKSRHQIMPKPGDLIVFPSYLRHWVYPNEQDEDRISIAFNIKYIKR